MPSRLSDPEAVAQARRLYETGKHRDEIAEFLGTKRPTLDRRITEWGWRRAPKRKAAREASDASTKKTGGLKAPDRDDDEPSRPDLALSITHAVERELAAIDAVLTRLGTSRLGGEESGDAERTARTLASLARALKELKQLDARGNAPAVLRPDADHDMPRDIDEFRRELARRMDALVAGRADTELPGSSE